MASLLVFGGLGQRNSPHLGLTYPLAEGEKQESRRNILMVPKASPGNRHTALSNHISQIRSSAKPDTGEVGKILLPKSHAVNLMTTGRDVGSSYRGGKRR